MLSLVPPATGVDLEHFAWFAGKATLDTGRPAVVEPFQRVFLADYFAGTTETLVLVSKKNGKTTTLALVALHHLCFVDDAEVVIAASSRDQATILLDQALKIVKRSPFIDERVIPRRGYREIRSARDDGRIRVLAADADTADGVIPTLALVDELHRHKSAELYGVFRDGLDARDGRMLTISTAGEDETTPLGELRAKALQLATVTRDGRHTYATDGASFAMHEWALTLTDKVDDMDVVKLANPASWQTKKRLQKRHDSPSTTPWQWARFACGLWVQGQESAISPVDWARCEEAAAVIPDHAPCWLGLDIAWTVDTTALTPLWLESDERRVAGPPVVLQPPDDRSMLDERAIVWALLVFAGARPWDRRVFTDELSDTNRPDVVAGWADAIERAAHPLHLLGVAYDRNAGGQQIVQQLEREHQIRFVEHSQDNAPMALAAARLAEAIPRVLRHNGDPVLRSHALTAVQRWLGGEKWKYDRPPRGKRRPIDALTALLFAHSVALGDDGPPDLGQFRIAVL